MTYLCDENGFVKLDFVFSKEQNRRQNIQPQLKTPPTNSVSYKFKHEKFIGDSTDFVIESARTVETNLKQGFYYIGNFDSFNSSNRILAQLKKGEWIFYDYYDHLWALMGHMKDNKPGKNWESVAEFECSTYGLLGQEEYKKYERELKEENISADDVRYCDYPENNSFFAYGRGFDTMKLYLQMKGKECVAFFLISDFTMKHISENSVE